MHKYIAFNEIFFYVLVKLIPDDGVLGHVQPTLRITGVHLPTSDGNFSSCGQCSDVLSRALQNGTLPEDRREEAKKLLSIWERWNLNHLRDGSPRQEEFIRNLTAHPGYGRAGQVLSAAGLNPDTEYLHNGKPYKYGSEWLYEPLPQDVLDWVASLSDDPPKGLPLVWY